MHGNNLLVSPNLECALKFLKEHLSRKALILIIGNCSIEYYGRASSKISWGDRLTIIKDDSAVIIHRPYGYEPVNWQPSGSYVDSYIDSDFLFLRIIRRKPREKLLVKFKEIYFLSSWKLEDHAKFHMFGEEEDLKQAILKRPEVIEEGLKIIETERKVSTGYIDILAKDLNGVLTVIELKKITAGEEAVAQLLSYVNSLRKETGQNVRGVLVAPKFTKRALLLLKKHNLEYKKLDLKTVIKTLYYKNGLTEFLES